MTPTEQQKADAPKVFPCPIREAILETLDYYDEEFPIDKYPNRESWYISNYSQGLQVGQLRVLLAAWNTRATDSRIKRMEDALRIAAFEADVLSKPELKKEQK